MTSDGATRTLRRPSRGGWTIVTRVGAILGILAFASQFLQLSATKAALASLVAQVASKKPETPIVVEYSPFGWFGDAFGWLWTPWTVVFLLTVAMMVLLVRQPRRPV